MTVEVPWKLPIQSQFTHDAHPLHYFVTKTSFSVKKVFPGMEISTVIIRLSSDRLISIMEIPILIRQHFYIEKGPSKFSNVPDKKIQFLDPNTRYWFLEIVTKLIFKLVGSVNVDFRFGRGAFVPKKNFGGSGTLQALLLSNQISIIHGSRIK